MRVLFIFLCSLLSAVVIAQTTQRPDAELRITDLPPPPPPPKMIERVDEELEPQITIVKKTGLTVEEYRSGGKLYMIKITPKIGKPYYMVDEFGDGKFSRQEGLDSGLRPPRWTIHKF